MKFNTLYRIAKTAKADTTFTVYAGAFTFEGIVTSWPAEADQPLLMRRSTTRNIVTIETETIVAISEPSPVAKLTTKA